MQLNPPSTGFASVVMFACASLWGVYWIPLRHVETLGVTGGWAVALLNGPAALALLLLVIWRWNAHRPHLRHALLIGLFTGTGLAFYATGLVYSTVVRATLLFYLTPIWATLIGMMWLGERTSWARWVAIAAGLVGLALLVSGGGSTPLNIGDFLAFLSGIFWAGGAAMIVRFGDVPVIGMTMVQFTVTALVASGIAMFIGTEIVPTMGEVVAALPLSAAVSILAFVPAICIIFWAQKYVFPGRAGVLMMSEVLMAVLTASLLIPEESMTLLQWSGAALIIGACLVEVLATPAEASAPT